MSAAQARRKGSARLRPLLLALLGASTLAWAWHAVAGVARELQHFNGFDGMHLEAAPLRSDRQEGRSWPTPG